MTGIKTFYRNLSDLPTEDAHARITAIEINFGRAVRKFGEEADPDRTTEKRIRNTLMEARHALHARGFIAYEDISDPEVLNNLLNRSVLYAHNPTGPRLIFARSQW